METVMRNLFLFLSKNKTMTKMAKEHGLKFGASRFVAGTTIEEASKKIARLNDEGLCATVDFLGEFVNCEKEAKAATDESVHAIETIAKNGLDSELSVKMTSLGLDISDDVVFANMRRILDAGKKHDVTITIDMEDESRCEKTLEIFKTLRKEYDNVGTVLQAYLYRTLGDLQILNEYNPYLRLVKGAYKESDEVAFADKEDVDENYRHLIKLNLLYGNYTAIATHDDSMIRYVKKLEKEHNLDRKQFEFQMLYGIRNDFQKQLADEGYRVRVYIPYGQDWYGYNMRRLAERPANVLFVLKGIMKK
ncbi:proline dehydrogenase [Aciduricibacillus chroicocephali]|uniref:proline dehydrogenase n=1 Tax=Aciduricibacillus chroicocephali TaxID=3054939 RepID=A0ABY9KT81_9BACI|nr:proline dehydrogenase [Bacillaceae bacterium 44XB]